MPAGRPLPCSADVVLLSGGSSVGRRDFTLEVFARLEQTEILAHGVSIRPGKPTILARRENVAFFGLPGHVGSAIVVFHLLVRPLLRRLAGAATNLRSAADPRRDQRADSLGHRP